MKKDISPQGYIDEDVIKLLDKINSKKDYATTSSCSGRIVLIKSKGKKGKAKWIFKSHKEVKINDLWNAFKKTKGKIWLLQEPMILHVKCKNKKSAQRLLNLCNKVGLKLSGVKSLKTYTVEIRGTERLEILLDKKYVNKKFLKILLEEANKNLRKTKERLKKLTNLF